MPEQLNTDRWLIISADLSELKQVRKILADTSADLFTATNPETGIRLIRSIRQPIHRILVGESITDPDFTAIQLSASHFSYPVLRFSWTGTGDMKTD